MNKNDLLLKLLEDPEYFNALTNTIFKLKNPIIERAKVLIEKIENDNFECKKDKGTLFEELIMIFFRDMNPNIFEVYHSVKSSSNEFDSLISIRENGCLMNVNQILGFSEKNFIIECKNYNEKIDVTWIGKFAHLMNSHNVKYGILFSKLPLTGLNKGKMTWNDASGLVKKFYLKYEAKIINLTLEDIKNVVLEKVRLVDILNKKSLDLQFDTEIKLIQHENSTKKSSNE